MVYEQFLSHEVVLGNRVYQNPLKYYQIQDSISLSGGDYELSEGYEGLKTAKVIQTLGLGNAVGMNGALYTSEVADKVADYQAQHGLDATGTVDLDHMAGHGAFRGGLVHPRCPMFLPFV